MSMYKFFSSFRITQKIKITSYDKLFDKKQIHMTSKRKCEENMIFKSIQPSFVHPQYWLQTIRSNEKKIFLGSNLYCMTLQ